MGQGSIRDAVVQHLFQQLHQQCFALCRKSVPSILRGIHPKQLATFNFSRLIDEWASTVPLFWQFLTTAADVSQESTANLAGVCTARASLLRERCIHMSAFHHITGLILFNGNASKLVSNATKHEMQLVQSTIAYVATCSLLVGVKL